jgi:phospholipase/lecithinase/hemolysin
MLTAPLVLLATALGAAASPLATPNYIFSFGDSYTQTGFDPNGVLPSASNPIGNPPYPGWTASGGSNWIGVTTARFNNSLIYTYNYAYGGATTDAKLVPPYTPTVLSLVDQVNQFLNGAGKKPAATPWTSSNSLFAIWIGVNDIGNSWYQSGDRAAFSDTLLNALFALVDKLYGVGARNFLFLNVPSIYRSPAMLNADQWSRDTEKAVIKTHNQKYAAKVASWKASHSGVRTWLYDTDASFNKLLDSPTTYGFKDATSYGQNGSFWFNDYHPGVLANDYLAKDVDALLSGTVW